MVFYGTGNQHLQMIRALYPKLRIVARDNVIRVLGDEEQMAAFEDSTERMRQHVLKFNSLNEENILDIVKGHRTTDDIPDDEKTRRLNEIIALQGEIALENNRLEVGREYEVLVEGESHRSKERLFGRNSQNKVLVFDREPASGIPPAVPGTYRRVKVTSCTAATLLGELVQ